MKKYTVIIFEYIVVTMLEQYTVLWLRNKTNNELVADYSSIDSYIHIHVIYVDLYKYGNICTVI